MAEFYFLTKLSILLTSVPAIIRREEWRYNRWDHRLKTRIVHQDLTLGSSCLVINYKRTGGGDSAP